MRRVTGAFNCENGHAMGPLYPPSFSQKLMCRGGNETCLQTLKEPLSVTGPLCDSNSQAGLVNCFWFCDIFSLDLKLLCGHRSAPEAPKDLLYGRCCAR